MNRRLPLLSAAVVAALSLGAAACGDDDDSSDTAPATEAPAAEPAPDAEPESDPAAAEEPEPTEAPAPETTAAAAEEASSEATPAELCTAIDEFEMALDAIDGDELDQIQAQIDAAQVEFDEVRAIAGDQYAAELDTMAAALQKFQDQLAEAAGGDLLDGALGMVDAVAELAAAGEVLDEQIDCPDDFNDGDVDDAEAELDAELDEEADELEQELDD